MSAERVYHPENWTPIEHWFPLSYIRRHVDWMWREGEIECYRFRQSGELLLLDPFGQCVERAETGFVYTDFLPHYERCAGEPYITPDDLLLGDAALVPVKPSGMELDEAEDGDADEERDDDEDEEDDEDEPNVDSLMNKVKVWFAEHVGDSIREEEQQALFHEINISKFILINELERKCSKVLKAAQYWLG
jgi:hypothetical protein